MAIYFFFQKITLGESKTIPRQRFCPIYPLPVNASFDSRGEKRLVLV